MFMLLYRTEALYHLWFLFIESQDLSSRTSGFILRSSYILVLKWSTTMFSLFSWVRVTVGGVCSHGTNYLDVDRLFIQVLHATIRINATSIVTHKEEIKTRTMLRRRYSISQYCYSGLIGSTVKIVYTVIGRLADFGFDCNTKYSWFC